MTQEELQEATRRRDQLPATMKVCDARGYDFKVEWPGDGCIYALAWAPGDQCYHHLKMEWGTWRLLEDVAL